MPFNLISFFFYIWHNFRCGKKRKGKGGNSHWPLRDHIETKKMKPNRSICNVRNKFLCACRAPFNCINFWEQKIYLQTEKGSESTGNKINIFDTKLWFTFVLMSRAAFVHVVRTWFYTIWSLLNLTRLPVLIALDLHKALSRKISL